MSTSIKLKMDKIFYSILLSLFVGFSVWYQGIGKPLATEEIDHYMKLLAESPRKEVDESAFSLHSMRRFAELDDGQPFYMVNLMRYHQKAQYPDGRTLAGIEAKELYGRSVLPMLISRASHPLLIVNPVLILHDDTQSDQQWDDIAIVRYRSRRDLLEMITSKDFDQAAIHKWASLETTIIIPSQGTWFPWPHAVIGVILIFIGLIGRFYFHRKVL